MFPKINLFSTRTLAAVTAAATIGGIVTAFAAPAPAPNVTAKKMLRHREGRQ